MPKCQAAKLTLKWFLLKIRQIFGFLFFSPDFRGGTLFRSFWTSVNSALYFLSIPSYYLIQIEQSAYLPPLSPPLPDFPDIAVRAERLIILDYIARGVRQ